MAIITHLPVINCSFIQQVDNVQQQSIIAISTSLAKRQPTASFCKGKTLGKSSATGVCNMVAVWQSATGCTDRTGVESLIILWRKQ